MKKKLLFIFIMLFSIFINVNAKEMTGFKCEYSVRNTVTSTNIGVIMQVTNYNKNDNTGTLLMSYQNSNGKYITISKGFNGEHDYYGTNDQTVLKFFDSRKSLANYISRYKSNGACPSIYLTQDASGNSISIDNDTTQTNSSLFSNNSATHEYLTSDGVNWVNKNDFYTGDNGQTTVKEDKVCNFTTYYNNKKTTFNVKFTTKYDANNNNSPSYYVSVNGNEGRVTNFNEDYMSNLGADGKSVYIKSSTLREVFNASDCASIKLYTTLNDVGHYYISSNKTDTQEESINGEATASHETQQQEDAPFNHLFPSLDFGDKMSCEEFLGSSVASFIRGVRIFLQSVAVGIAIVNGMMTFIPAITSKDSNALSKALSKFVKILIILAIVILLPTLVKVLGNLVGFDISCI